MICREQSIESQTMERRPINSAGDMFPRGKERIEVSQRELEQGWKIAQ